MSPKVKTYLSRAGTVLLILFASLVFYRMFVLEREGQTADAVARIHATKLTLDDVMGTNLPPKPANPDTTVQGVDANKNGIRDDVELAIFETYPKSAKTRAVLLQYALALQTQMTLMLENTGTVTATVETSTNNALSCIWSISSRSDLKKFVAETTALEDFVKNRQLNTKPRQDYLHKLLNNNLKSFGMSEGKCDLDLTTLPN